MTTAHFLGAFTEPSMIWNNYVWLLNAFSSCVLFAVTAFLLGWFLNLIFILLRAHTGYLHFVSAVCRWSSSCFNSWGFEQMVLALWCRVPITLYLDGNVWWLSQCRYRSVCVGFLYTVVLRLPSSFGITNMSRKGMDPSSLWSSLVNCICWSMELMSSKKALLCDDGKGVIHISLPEIREVWSCANCFNLKVLHIEIINYGADGRAHSTSF